MLGCRALLGQALPHRHHHHHHRHRLAAAGGRAERPALLVLALGLGGSLYRGLASRGSLFGGMAGKGSALAGEPNARGGRAKARRPAAARGDSSTAAAAAAAAALPEEAAPAAAAAAPPPEDAGAAAPSPSPAAKRPRMASAPSLFVSTNLRQLQPKAARIGEQLAALYPDPPIPLDHASGFQLLCAVVLSAQSTDKKVNEVTPALFALAPDAPAMAALDVQTIEACIRQLGLAPTKAKNLQGLSQVRRARRRRRRRRGIHASSNRWLRACLHVPREESAPEVSLSPPALAPHRAAAGGAVRRRGAAVV